MIALTVLAYMFVSLRRLKKEVASLSVVIDENNTILKSLSSMTKWMVINREILDPIDIVCYVTDANDKIQRMIDNEQYEEVDNARASVNNLLELFKRNNPNVEFSFVKEGMTNLMMVDKTNDYGNKENKNNRRERGTGRGLDKETYVVRDNGRA